VIRVLHVINGLGSGGAERQLVALVRGLDRARFAPEVAILEGGGRYEAELREAGVPVHVCPRPSRFSVAALPALVRHARGKDVVHAWLTPGVLFGLLAGRLARVPVLVGSERGSTYARGSTLHRGLLAAEAMLLRGSSGVIANSRAGAVFAGTRGVPSDRIHVVYNALPHGWPPPGPDRTAMRAELDIDPDRFTVLVAATLTPKKDHRGLFEALDRIRKEGREPLVLLAGDGPLRNELQAEGRRLGLQSMVRFLGERRDVPDLLRAVDLALLPSKEREGCSNFVMEAMSLGAPLLATDAGGTGEILTGGETGWVVPARDPAALAAGIVRLMDDRHLRERLARNAATEAWRRFALSRLVDETQSLYLRFLEGNAGGTPHGQGVRP
jgi:glycosyltransferase involved in cell wall biosynthesis